MKLIQDLRRVATELEFDGVARPSVGLQGDDVLVCNAIDAPLWSDDPVQVWACGCGSTGCTSGDYVQLRRVDEFVILMPAFSSLPSGLWDRTIPWEHEYLPPSWLEQEALLVDREAWTRALGDPVALLPLTHHDAARLVQWEAPQLALGADLASVRPHVDLLPCVEDGPAAVKALKTLLENAEGQSGSVHVRAQDSRDQELRFGLDGSEWIEWSPLVETPLGLRLRLAPGFVIDG